MSIFISLDAEYKNRILVENRRVYLVILILLLFGVGLYIVFCDSDTKESYENNKSNRNNSADTDIDKFGNYLDSAFHHFTDMPDSVKNSLDTLVVGYWDFKGTSRKGILIVAKKVKGDIKYIFQQLYRIHFPIERIEPMFAYNWSDRKSMEDNNTSNFNYRTIAGTDRMSNHAYGRAIDINPVQNPYLSSNGRKSPQNSYYHRDSLGTIWKDDTIIALFKKKKWSWGGDWKTIKDYQHFDLLE